MGYASNHVTQTISKIPEKHRKPLKDLIDLGGDLSERLPLGYNDKIAMYISELFGKSELDSARPFQEWLYEEVLPSIRKKGFYRISQKRASPALEDAHEQLELVNIQIQIEAGRRQIEAEKRQAEVEKRQAEVERRGRVFDTMQALKDAGMSVDDRMVVHARDYLASGMGAASSSTPSSQQRQEICLQSFVRDHKKDVDPPITDFQKFAIKLGKLCVKHAKVKFGETFVPNKKTILCNGQQTEVNCWWHKEHKEIVDAAWAELINNYSAEPKRPKKKTRKSTSE